MNKIILSTLLVLFSCSLFAGTGDSISGEQKQIGIIYSPEYSYRTLKSNADGASIADFRNKTEIAKFGYSAGIRFSYLLSSKCGFEIQALFSDKGEQSKKVDLKNTVYISSQDKVPNNSSYVNHYYYLDIPLKINYHVTNNKNSFFLTAGASVNTFLFERTTTTIDNKDGSSEKYSSTSHPKFESVNLALLAGFGFDYHLTDQYSITLSPVFKHSITSITNSTVKGYLYSAGINAGLSYVF